MALAGFIGVVVLLLWGGWVSYRDPQHDRTMDDDGPTNCAQRESR